MNVDGCRDKWLDKELRIYILGKICSTLWLKFNKLLMISTFYLPTIKKAMTCEFLKYTNQLRKLFLTSLIYWAIKPSY